MSRTQRLKQARREERQRLEAERQRRTGRRRELLLVAGGGLAALLAVLGATLFSGSGSEERTSAVPTAALPGRAMPIEGRKHLAEGTKVAYRSNPPTSGNHWPKPVAWGTYRSPVPDERGVHNLEHGGIWITYTGIDESARRQLEALARDYPSAVLLSPRPQNGRGIALASWGRLEKLSSLDEGRILAFISANVNNSPEPLASIEETGLAVGNLFPDFRVTEASGHVLTRASLRGKPSIIWFTTTYCVPCQVGAKTVADLDDELGGKAFNVLVVFVDPGEPVSEPVRWRSLFANADWLVALDRGLTLTQKVQLRYLDTKYLLDSAGRIVSLDVSIADDKYVSRVRETVEQAG